MNKNNILTSKPNLLYILIIVMSAIFVNMQPLTNHLSLIVAVLFGVALFSSLIILTRSKSKIVLKKHSISLWMMLIFSSISLINSINIGQSLKYILFYTITLLFMSILSKDTKWFTLFWRIQLFFSIAHVLITLLSFFNTDLYMKIFYPILSDASKIFTSSYIYKFNFHAGIAGQTGTNAFFISIGLSIIFSRLLSNDKKYKLSSILLFMAFFFALFMTGKRGFIIGNFIAMAITYYYSGKATSNKVKQYMKYFLGITIAILLIYLSYLFVPPVSQALNRFFISSSTGDISSGRFGLYKLALQTFIDNPITGVGIDAFIYVPYAGSLENVGAHNDWLQFLAEVGVIGTMFLFYFVIRTLKGTINLEKYCELDTCYKPFIYVSLYSQLYILFHSLVGMPFHNYSMLLTYIIFASIPYAVINKAKENYRVRCI